jgi:hypothetical protein
VKPFIIGESNPYGADPYFALYPAPKGCTGWRLCNLVLQMQPAAYLREFERRNVLEGPRWSAPAARAAASKLAEEIGEAKVVLLGAKVCAAFRLEFEPFTVLRGKAAILPHPSGLSRAWNEPGAFDRARATVRQLLGEVPA